MKAFILAAGYGTRLRPLTYRLPKPLICVWGKPVIAHIIDRLVEFGIDEFVLNLHHLADKIKRYLEINYPTLRFIYSFEESILDTGGGLKKASSFLNDEFILHNGDIITDVDFNAVVSFHKKNKNDVTVVIMERDTPRKLCFDDDMRLRGWINEESRVFKGDVDGKRRYAFCGIHIINPSIFRFMPFKEVFGIFEFYIANLDKIKISGVLVKPRYWYDIGDISKLTQIRQNPHC